MNQSTTNTLLIIDDDDRFRERLALSFKKRGYTVSAFDNGSAALEYSVQHEINFAIVDLKLAGEWGLNIVEGLIHISPHTEVVVLTAYGSIATAIEALKLGAKNYLQKPVSVDEIENCLLDCGENKKLVQEATETPSLAKVEWEHINRVLTECDGNIRKTAAQLGLHRRTLQRKLAKYPVNK